MPLLGILVGCTITVGFAALARMEMALATRRAAWARRDQRPPDRLDVTSPAFLARVPRQGFDGGLAKEIQTRELTTAPYISSRSFLAESRHFVMGGSWDFATIPFHPHGRLQPDPRFGVFSPSGNLDVDLGAFRKFPSAVLGAIGGRGR